MHTIVRLPEYTDSEQLEIKKLGKLQGGDRYEIEVRYIRNILTKARIVEKKMLLNPEMFPGMRIRSDDEQARLLAICATCKRNHNGRCSICRSCGGGIPVVQWVQMSNHICPDKKW